MATPPTIGLHDLTLGYDGHPAVHHVSCGIAPGTLWADVPQSWECPDCGVAKADFEAVEI